MGSRERMEYAFVGRTLRAELDTRFVLAPMPAEPVKGIAEPVVTYAVQEVLS